MPLSQIKKDAKETLRGNWNVALGTLIVAAVIIGAASASVVLGILIAGPISVGVSAVYLDLMRRNKSGVDAMFAGFNRFFDNFVLGLLVNLFTFLWSLLLIIPGIIAKYSYAMAYFIQCDHPEMIEGDAIKASKKMMQGHKWELFLLDVSFIGWYLLCILTLGLLSLYVGPYHRATRAEFYKHLLEKEESATQAFTPAEDDPFATSSSASQKVEEEAPASNQERESTEKDA